jgi:sugar/nucleoside kinase (ribokinase family)
MKKIDFLAVGDIVIDAFIELQDANVNCDINDENCTITMRFADKIPYKNVTVAKAVGNSPNATVSASRLGLVSSIITNIGDDQNGKDCIETLKENNIDTSMVQIQDGMKTNYHYVLSYSADRTILIKHEAYNYDFDKAIGDNKPTWIYLSSVADHTLPYHEQIASYLEKNPEVKLAFQPGTFQMKLGIEKLKKIYARTEVFFCNVEESQRILGVKESDIKILLKSIHDLGPKIVFITDGPKGAYAFDGENAWFMPIYPDPAPPLERTGAGDAFSSTATVAIAMGKSLEEALSWGPINSMSVVQYVGAQKGLLSQEKLLEYLAQAPADYKPKKI